MNIKEFKSLKLKDKILYKGKIITIETIKDYPLYRGIEFQHNNEKIHPNFMYISFWSDIEKHQELIELMIKIPNM